MWIRWNCCRAHSWPRGLYLAAAQASQCYVWTDQASGGYTGYSTIIRIIDPSGFSMSLANANRHAELSHRLIEQANYEMHTMGDRVQASDKASGAVAQVVKAIAEDRNWRHSSHNLRRDIIDLVADEFGQPELRHLQAIADQLHENYYEDRLGDPLLNDLLADVTRLIESLWDIRDQGPNPYYNPSPERERTINRLLVSEEEARADDSIDFPPPMPPFNPPGR